MNELKFRPLGDVARLQAGVGFPLELQGRKSGDFPLAKVGDISRVGRSGCAVLHAADHYVDKNDLERLKTEAIPKGSILFAKIGEAIRQNHRVIAGCELLVDNNAMAAIPTGETVPEYLYHYLRTVDFYRLASATTVPALRKSELERLPIPWHAISEQRRIADILDRAEALRAKRRAALAQLDTLTQSIFLDLFGDPVSNPKGWPDPKLGASLAFQQYGPRFYNESYSVDGTRIVRITDLDDAGNLDFSQMPRLSVSEGDLAKYQLKPGDLIFARTGATVGKVAMVRPDDPPCIAGAYFIAMRFEKRITPLYARCVLASPSVRAIVTGRSRQAAQQNFSGPGLRELPLPIPPRELQEEFAKQITCLEKLRAAQRRSLAELDALFASLQHRAFRGEL